MWLLAIIALTAIFPAVLFRMLKFVVMTLSLKLYRCKGNNKSCYKYFPSKIF
jgi:hypothetical protein